MPHPTIIRTETADVDARLSELGLTRAMIDEVRRVAVAARNSATGHHPRNHGGLMAFGEAVRALRDESSATGFRAVWEGGLEICLNEALGIAILVGKGNAGTGKPDQHSSTQYPRGPRGREVLESNQMVLFDKQQPDRPARRTWLLLIRQTDEHVWSELSLAAAVGEDGKVAVWDERIIFPPFDLGAPEPTALSPTEPTPEIEISIVSR